jgi:Ca-activated chloride channel homolog
MEFAQPWAALLALAAIPVLLLGLPRGRKGAAIPSAAAPGLARPTLRLRLARALPLLRALALVLFAFAAAGPRIGSANAVVPAQGIDIALSLDISSSMTGSRLGNDKNRLEATKDVIREFIKGEEDDRIGLVVFARDALPLSPPTLDYKALDSVVADVESGLITDGTGIGVGISEAVNMLKESTAATRIVILLTDGEHNTLSITPEDAASLAAALKIRVYTIGVVSAGGGSSGIDERRLRALAELTGGRYFSADSPESLLEVYQEIDQLETSGVGRERFERFTQLAPWFALPGAALLLLELVLGATWLRRAGR